MRNSPGEGCESGEVPGSFKELNDQLCGWQVENKGKAGCGTAKVSRVQYAEFLFVCFNMLRHINKSVLSWAKGATTGFRQGGGVISDFVRLLQQLHLWDPLRHLGGDWRVSARGDAHGPRWYMAPGQRCGGGGQGSVLRYFEKSKEELVIEQDNEGGRLL
jgi:hypothetical protein